MLSSALRSLVTLGRAALPNREATTCSPKDPHAAESISYDDLAKHRPAMPRLRLSGFVFVVGGSVLVFIVCLVMTFSSDSADAASKGGSSVDPAEAAAMEIDPTYVARIKEQGMGLELPDGSPPDPIMAAAARDDSRSDALPAGVPRLEEKSAASGAAAGAVSAEEEQEKADLQARRQSLATARKSNVFLKIVRGNDAVNRDRQQPGGGQAVPGLQALGGALAGLQAAASGGGPPNPLAQLSGAGLGGSFGTGDGDPNGHQRKAEFLRQTRLEVKALESAEPADVHLPRSRFEIWRGTPVQVQLLTAINSDLPGPIQGRVISPVYDTATGECVLIPQLAVMHGRYDSRVEFGQRRLLICWETIQFPNGSWVNLDCSPGVDQIGQAGVTGDVDNHWSQVIAGATLSALLSAGAQVAAGDVTGFRPTFAQSVAGGAAADISNTGQQITRRQLNRQATITVPPGVSLNAMLSKTLVVPPYYEADR
jgi:type IV secretory pathway VirB10-like protein